MRGTPPIQRRPITDALRAVDRRGPARDQRHQGRGAARQGDRRLGVFARRLVLPAHQRHAGRRQSGRPGAQTRQPDRPPARRRAHRDEIRRGIRDLASGSARRPRHRAGRRALPRHRQALRIRSGEPQALGRRSLARRRSVPAPFGLRRACLPLGRPARGDRAYRARPFARRPAHRALDRMLHRAPRRPHLVARRRRARPAQARDAGQCRLDDAAARSRCPGKAAKVA